MAWSPPWFARRTAFRQAHGHGEHDAVPEGDDGGFHVVVGVAALGDVAPGQEEVAAEVLADELQRNHPVRDAEAAAVLHCVGNLPGVVLGSVVEGDGQRDAVLVLVQERRAVQPAGIDEDCFHSLFIFFKYKNNFLDC